MFACEGKLLARICILPGNEGLGQAVNFIIFFLFCVCACASDISFPVSADYSQENSVAFLQLPAEAALHLPGHSSKCFIGYKVGITYYVVGNGVCVLL